MAITGIRRLTYLVDDLPKSKQFFADFGLSLTGEAKDEAWFEVMNGSQVRLLQRDHPGLPKNAVQTGIGVVECTWAVDGREAFDKLCADLAIDHSLATDDEGIVHFVTPFGQAIAFQHWQPRHVVGAPSPINTVGRIERLNQPRKWIDRAIPKRIHHVVWTFPDVDEALDYYRDRLGFRLTDIQKGFGVYIRADGAYEHHNIFIADANAPMPGFDGTLKFHHANFEVEDIDEMLVAKNYLDRRGYRFNDWGFGRHRLASSAFLYVPCPAGGEAEYGADSDCVDDSWKPRVWEGKFGSMTFMHNLPHWLVDEPSWDVTYARPDQTHFIPAVFSLPEAAE